MPHPDARTSTRRMLGTLVVAALSALAGFGLVGAAALGFQAALDAALNDPDWESRGGLARGRPVAVVAECDARPCRGKIPTSGEEFYGEVEPGPMMGIRVDANTPAMVRFDSGDSDATANRAVVIEILAGKHAGMVVALPRGRIRER
ncbi:hypothetical protein TA3x_005561 [Tundrisphaera sp. TA3]|uniref:hypothetical protein n=1 Tax=Tundrisphaera sp. TA3 TaxID=3435775 RepID=UPI003EB6C902